MNLSIDLSSLVNDAPFRKELGKLPGKKFKLNYPLEKLKEILKYLPEEGEKRITSLLDKERRYIRKLGIEYDSHIELEKLGVSVYSREFTTEITLNDAIDLIFWNLMGTPLEVTRSIPNYKMFSSNLIGMDLEKIDIGIEDLMNLHPTIEEFVLNSAVAFSSIVSFTEEEFTRKFMTHFCRVLQEEVARMLNIIVVGIMSSKEDETISLRSRKFGEFIIGKDTSTPINVEICSNGIKYPFTFETYSKLGYIFKSR